MIEPGSVAPDTALCGDEAALLHELAPDAWIGVGADRASAFESVRARAGKIDVAILDDGFQHHRLARDIDVVAVTGASRAQILFRDFTRALKRASLIVYTKGEAFPCAPESIPAIRARYELPQAEEGAAPLCLVTGLADGAEVQRELERKGYRIAVHIPFRDHARYDGEMVNRIVSEARKQRHRVATTGKDWVKWRELGLPAASDVLVLEPAIRFERIDGGTMNENLWNRIVWSDPSH